VRRSVYLSDSATIVRYTTGVIWMVRMVQHSWQAKRGSPRRSLNPAIRPQRLA
jgi:hypothetical protein